MTQYIPDLTERFPEGLDGIDMTDSYFPSRMSVSDMWCMVDDMDMDDDLEIPYESED